MIKKIVTTVLTLSIAGLLVGFLIVPTAQLLEISVNNSYRDHWLRAPAFLYLQHLRGLQAFPRDTHGPPLHVIVKECRFVDDPVCSKALEWALNSGESVNEDDKSALGFTPLHWSAYGCDAVSARLLISKGASRSSRASGEKLKDKTPLDVLNVMATSTCPDSKSRELIENMLTLKDDQ